MKPPLIVKVGDTYGLCNRLFPFAHAIAAAEEYGWMVRHASFEDYCYYFEGTIGQKFPEYPATTTRNLVEMPLWASRCYHLRRRLLRRFKLESSIALTDNDFCDLSDPVVRARIQSAKTTQLSGLYFFASECFDKHSDRVRQFFRPIDTIGQLVAQNVRMARDCADVLVGVHIRHGDYETFCGGIMYYTFAEYAELMRSVADLFPGRRVSFLICSNSTPPDDGFVGLRTYVGPRHVVGDLYALAQCDYIIGPPSTYSEWASFYGEVPRYMHRAKDYQWNGQQWPGVTLHDFVVHREGFARCSPSHPATLIGNKLDPALLSANG
jgi:hypothetical protein